MIFTVENIPDFHCCSVKLALQNCFLISQCFRGGMWFKQADL